MIVVTFCTGTSLSHVEVFLVSKGDMIVEGIPSADFTPSSA